MPQIIKALPRNNGISRPANIDEKRILIASVYRENNWRNLEHKTNCEMLKIPFIELAKFGEYQEKQLDVFIKDFEDHRMVIFA